jgi:AcrR family transcriptional regulator
MPNDPRTASGARRRGRPPRNEEEFLEAALVVFAERGFDAPSMDDVAAAAQTTKPTLYARFGSKEQLYERVVRREADAFIAHVLHSYEYADDTPVRQTIEGPMAAWFAYVRARPQVLQLLFAPDRSTAAQQVADEVEERIVTGLATAVERTLARTGRSAPAQARFLAAMVFGATLHATRDNERAGGLETEHAVALASSFVYAGYRGIDVELLRSLRRGTRRRSGRATRRA